MESPMSTWYDEKYFFAERHGGKEYVDSVGEEREFGYTKGGLWNFQGILNKLIMLLGKPKSILDVGCGCGGFPATCNANKIEALGLEFSQFAIDNAVMDSKKFLKQWDIENIPWPIEHQYEWVTGIDLMEHLFADKVDEIIKEMKRVSSKYIILKICTAQRPREVWSAKRAILNDVLAQAKGEGFEWLVVSGHINSQFPKYWLEKFVDNDWKNREDLAERFKRELNLPKDWRTTLILKKYSYDLELES